MSPFHFATQVLFHLRYLHNRSSKAVTSVCRPRLTCPLCSHLLHLDHSWTLCGSQAWLSKSWKIIDMADVFTAVSAVALDENNGWFIHVCIILNPVYQSQTSPIIQTGAAESSACNINPGFHWWQESGLDQASFPEISKWLLFQFTNHPLSCFPSFIYFFFLLLVLCVRGWLWAFLGLVVVPGPSPSQSSGL